MYTADGLTREFPAPREFAGFVVLSPPGGKGFLMKQDQAYTVRQGTVFFYIAPPDGWSVRFDTEGVEAMAGVCTVIYSDGNMKTVERDPWELLVTARGVLSDARKTKSDIEAAAEAAKIAVNEKVVQVNAELEARMSDERTAVERRVTGAADSLEERANKRFGDSFAEIKKAAADAENISRSAAEIVLSAKGDIENAISGAEERMGKELSRQAQSVMDVQKEIYALCEDAMKSADRAEKAADEAGAEAARNVDTLQAAYLREIEQRAAEINAMFDEFTARLSALRQGDRNNIVRRHPALTRNERETRIERSDE
ncbi:hypothetical protein FACS1894187_04960 [Synergistales bacterium]|nr:hypothetical protein FACS1894187_04960 [Synergistales bacterium]